MSRTALSPSHREMSILAFPCLMMSSSGLDTLPLTHLLFMRVRGPQGVCSEHLLLWRETCSLMQTPSDGEGGAPGAGSLHSNFFCSHCQTQKGNDHLTYPGQSCPCTALSPFSPGPRCAALWAEGR